MSSADAEVAERVGAPVSVEVTACHFGLGSKDPQLIEGLDRVNLSIANAIVWADCRVTGPKGEERVAAWLLPKKNNNIALVQLLTADKTDRGTIQGLLPQLAGEL